MVLERNVTLTWTLGVALGAGVLVWGLAATGVIGAALSAQPADPAQALSLPELPADAQRVPALEQFAAISERPLFAADRRPRPYLLAGENAEQGAAAVRLTGVLQTPSLQMATLTTDNDRSLRLRLNGEAVDGWQLLALESRRATVSGPGGTQVLELQVFNGQGGQPPTAIAPPPGGARPAPPAVQQPLNANATAAAAAAAADAAMAAARAQQQATSNPGATPPPASNGPSEAQLQAIRARIQARRQQLQQQFQQQQSQQQGQGNPADNR